MLKIFSVGGEVNSCAVIKSIVSELDFLFETELSYVHYQKFCPSLKTEILNPDYKKIFVIYVNNVNRNGCFKLVKFIRDNDWHSEIILIKECSMVMQGLWPEIRKIFAIIDNNQDLKKVLRTDLQIILKHNCQDKVFKYKNRDINLNIYLSNILYIYRETKDRKVVIVTDSNNYVLNMGLREVFLMLDDRFKQVHKSCFVNATRIEKFDWNKGCFTLDNGEKIDRLSKRYKENIDVAFCC